MRFAYALVAAAVLATTGCGSTDDHSSLRTELEAVSAERDALADRVADLEGRLAAVDDAAVTPSSDAPSETTEPEVIATTAVLETTTSAATPETSTTAAPAEPAAIDASPFVTAFGDLSAVVIPQGDPGAVSIALSAPTLDRRGTVVMVVRNNTGRPVGEIDVTGTARDESGALVGSGSSQGFQPKVVAPGEIAFGYVYFDSDIPEGSVLAFEFSVAAEPPSDYFLPVTVTEINNTGDQVVGMVVNQNAGTVDGPITADVLCFGSDGSISAYVDSYVEQDDLAPGSTGSFAIDLFREQCSAGIAASSGYGR